MAYTGFNGTGSTISGGTLHGDILSLAGPGGSVEDIDMSYMGTTTAKDFEAADLVDWGEVTIELAYDGTLPTVGGAAIEWTISLTNSGLDTIVFDAYVKSFEPSVPLEGKATATMVLKVTGAIS